MEILDALKETETYLRNGNKTMYWDNVTKQWVVSEDIHRKGRVVICETEVERRAIKVLTGEE